MLILVFIPCAGTVLARLAVFPVIVKGQREAAKLNNVLPEMTKLTNKMNEAKQSGNKFECKNKWNAVFTRPISVLPQSAFHKLLFYITVGKAYSELTLFQKKHDVNPLRGFLVPLVQVSVPFYILVIWHIKPKQFHIYT